MMRVAMILGAVVAGAAAGALVFKIVGEERIGAQIKVFTTRFGVSGSGGGNALDLVEKFAPGTRSGFEGAIIGTVAASVIVTAAVSVAIAEITS